MFSVQSEWLHYSPFLNYKLPDIEFKPRYGDGEGENPGIAKFVSKKTGEVVFTRTMYRLRWPGERDRDHDDSIPSTIVQHWPSELAKQCKDRIQREDKGAFEAIPIRHILEQEMLPPADAIPEAIAYHVAVNHKLYFKDKGIRKAGVQFPVAGLPTRRVQQILDTTFALNDEAISTLKYLKWLAEGHHHHPLFGGFDTCIRESLMGVSHEAARLFFYLIYDYQYDEENGWWARDDRKLDYQIPLYLHWVGRTGMGMYQHLSNIPPAATHCSERSWDVRYPDILDQLKRWDCWKMRKYMHETGEDPCASKGPGSNTSGAKKEENDAV